MQDRGRVNNSWVWNYLQDEDREEEHIYLDTEKTAPQMSKYKGPSRFTDYLTPSEQDYHNLVFGLVFRALARQYKK